MRLPAVAVEKLDRAAEALGMRKKDLVAGLVSKYVDPDSDRGLTTLGSLSTPRSLAGPVEMVRGSYSFVPDGPLEIMNAEQAGQFLQIEAATVIELADEGQLPGRKLGGSWRFSRAALVAWLSAEPKRAR